MKVDETINEFLDYLRAIGQAETTVQGSSKVLELFSRFLVSLAITDLRMVTREVIESYRNHLQAKQLVQTTRVSRLQTVQRLFRFLVERQRLLIDPTLNVRFSNRPRKYIQPVISMAEMQELLNQPDDSTPNGLRDRAIMELLYSTAIRRKELLMLELTDLDQENNLLFVRHGKGEEQRVVPIGSRARQWLEKYIKEVREIHSKKHPQAPWLFLSPARQPLSTDIIRNLLRKYREKTGITTKVSTHTFRRSCATHLLQQGADVRYVQQLLGHKSIRTTQWYLNVMPMDIKQTHSHTHPNGKE